MDRRTFIQLAGTPALLATTHIPAYRVVSGYAPASKPGMPGPYRGAVTRLHSETAIDPETDRVDDAVIRKMLSTGMQALTNMKSDRDAWASFFSPSDVVGIKVNCSAAPKIMSTPEVVRGNCHKPDYGRSQARQHLYI